MAADDLNGVAANKRAGAQPAGHSSRPMMLMLLSGRRMQGHWVHGDPYYRCRFASEYALANRVKHPLSVNLDAADR